MTKAKFTVFSLMLTIAAFGGTAYIVYSLNPAVFDDSGLTTTLFGIAGGAAVLLWGLLQLIVPKPVAPQQKQPAPQKQPEKKPEPQIPVYASAVQLLSILQRQGRFLDFFVKEDLSLYDDAQIGAAVRNVHEGCKKALNEYFKIEPVKSEPEGSDLTVPKGFNANEIRLIGNVSGEPPFSGTLMHHGWRVKSVNLPQIMKADEKDMILAAAEVEVK